MLCLPFPGSGSTCLCMGFELCFPKQIPLIQHIPSKGPEGWDVDDLMELHVCLICNLNGWGLCSLSIEQLVLPRAQSLWGFSSVFNFQTFKYFLVELWILRSKFKPTGNRWFVSEYFSFRETNLRFEVIGLLIWRSEMGQSSFNRSEFYCCIVLWLALVFFMQPCHIRFTSTIHTRSGFCLQYTKKCC